MGPPSGPEKSQAAAPRTSDPQLAALKIQIVHLEGQRFADPQPCPGQRQDNRIDLRHLPLGCLKQDRQFLTRECCDLPCLPGTGSELAQPRCRIPQDKPVLDGCAEAGSKDVQRAPDCNRFEPRLRPARRKRSLLFFRRSSSYNS